MADNTPTATEELTLSYQTRLALQVELLSEPCDPTALFPLNDSNEAVLRTMMALDEWHHEGGDESGGLAQEVARIDFKLNMLLDLVGELLTSHAPLPQATPVKLAAHRIQWLTDQTFTVGDQLQLRIYLQSRYPRPLEFVGQVVKVEPQAANQMLVTLSPEGVEERVQELLEKFIFRQHRRMVASERARRDSSD